MSPQFRRRILDDILSRHPPQRIGRDVSVATYRVTLDPEIQQALATLAEYHRHDRVEYAGGIQFAEVHGRAIAQKIVACLGEESSVPGNVLLVCGDEADILFHLHPREPSLPSFEDLHFLLSHRWPGHVIISPVTLTVLASTERSPKNISLDDLEGVARLNYGIDRSTQLLQVSEQYLMFLERDLHLRVTMARLADRLPVQFSLDDIVSDA